MKEKFKKLLRETFIIGILLSIFSFAKAQTITGKVVDENKIPLPGVNVVIKGTTVGTITDFNGDYNIVVTNPAKDILIFSFLGYENVEMPVAGKTIIDVNLIPAVEDLEEVVVIGYQTVKKKDLTGSVSSISGEKLRDIPISSTAEALTGRLAGVQITTTEGSPDAEIKIRVRGGGSITQDNSPLYIVDGFPVSSFNDIAPTDIASIDVLKDASSTAIYGARGANGVVIITTKGGKSGKVKIDYNTYYGFKQIAKKLDVLNPYEYALWQYELAGPSGTPHDNFEKYYGVYDDLELYDYQRGTNWQDEVFGRTATSMYHNINISGGTNNMKYGLSYTRNSDEGIMIGSEYIRDNLNFKLNSEINKKLSIDFNTRLSNTKVDGAGTSTEGTSSNSRLKHTIKYAPIEGMQAFSDDLDYASDIQSSSQLYNPVEITNDDYKHKNRLNSNFNGALNFKIFEELIFRSEYGIELSDERTDRFYGTATSQAKNDGAGQPIVTIESKDGVRQHIANTLTFNKQNYIPGHNLSILLGQELNSYYYKRIFNESRYFPVDLEVESALALMNLGEPRPTETYESPSDNMSSFFSSINYHLYEKYLATVTFRADGSSKFAEGNRWGYFPAFAFAWRLSEEGFMNGIRAVSNMKLRVSVGSAGNNRIKDDLWKLVYSTNDNDSYYINETMQNQLIPGSELSNPDLRWETMITRNIGLDFGFFNSRLNGTIDGYYNTTKDLLIAAIIPSNTGYSTQMQNIGITSNKGVELTLNGFIVERKDFTLSASFNIAFNKNKVEELGDVKSSLQTSDWFGSGGPTGDYLLKEGEPVGLMYGYETDGMYSFDDFTFDTTGNKYLLNEGVADNSTLIGASKYFGPGTLKFKEQNTDGDTNHVIDPSTDRVIIGNANPKHIGGFSISATFKGFDYSVFFNWVYGNDVYNANKLEFTSFPNNRLYGNLLEISSTEHRFTIVDHETGEFVNTDPEKLAEINSDAEIWHPIMQRVVLHSWAIEDGSFLRCNNMTLGYTLPKSITSKLRIKKIRLYVSAYNLFVLTNYSGYDPEVDTRRKTPLTPNVDYSAYPRSRSIIGGVNLTF